MTPVLTHDGLRLYHGDALAVLRALPAASCHALVTDPPAGIGFMGVAWDSYEGKKDSPASRPAARAEAADFDWTGSRENARNATQVGRINAKRGRQFRAAIEPIFRECLRVLTPGAHGLVWALPRTSHWTATALEDAGFEVRDVVTHHFGSGFPKSLDVARAVDAQLRYGRSDSQGLRARNGGDVGAVGTRMHGHALGDNRSARVPEPQPIEHAAACAWQGWGTALKPGSEHWILVRAPLAERTVAGNVLAHGTGGLNIDGCRVDAAGGSPSIARRAGACLTHPGMPGFVNRTSPERYGAPHPGEQLGRWPANLVLSHSAACNGDCASDCPVAELDRQSGELVSGHMAAGTRRSRDFGYSGGGAGSIACERDTYGDGGGASRFFYCAKAASAERDDGLDEFPLDVADPYGQHRGRRMEDNDGKPARRARNTHPTVKPVALMRWLCRLVTPPGGVVLDPFAGSGTTLVAAHAEGFGAVGIEREAAYVALAAARLPRQHALFARPAEGP